MSLNDLANQIEQRVVDDTNGWGQPIQLTYFKTNQTVDTRALCMDLRQEGLNEKAQVYEDGMAFLSVFVDVRPQRGDLITFDGRTYKVENMEGTKPYDLFCRTNAKHSRARSGRREK